MDDKIIRTDADAVAEIVRRHIKPHVLEVSHAENPAGETEILLVPEGFKAQSVKPFADEYRTRPERRTGTAELHDLDSFCAHVNRFKDFGSLIFADKTSQAPSLLAVLDYHPSAPAEPRFCKHRARYAFPISDEWTTWHEKDGQAMNQQDFAEFIEARIADVADPSVAGESAKKFLATMGASFASPAKLLELSRGLSIRVGSAVRHHVNLGSGETQIAYTANHEDEKGAPLKVPGAALLAIPVFRNGPLYQVPARLRYRVNGGSILWFFEMYRDDVVFDHALTEACDSASEKTGLLVLSGKPEA